jgi:hypothetical protein
VFRCPTQALINDLLDLKLNRVTIEVPEKEGGERSRSLSVGFVSVYGWLGISAASVTTDCVTRHLTVFTTISIPEVANL